LHPNHKTTPCAQKGTKKNSEQGEQNNMPCSKEIKKFSYFFFGAFLGAGREMCKLLQMLGLALSDAKCERGAYVEPMRQLFGRIAAAMTAVPNAEEVAQDLPSGDAAADRAHRSIRSGASLLSLIAHSIS
jgi:hypothetical protein